MFTLTSCDTRIFQSTLPQGERLGAGLALIAFFSFISIHAPARGATRVGHTGQEVLVISIHAPARGATLG